jgi:hypothetical protein
MQITHKRRALRRAADLWKRNWAVLLLAWGLAGTLAVAANNEGCATVDLGWFGTVLNNVILRTHTLLLIAILGIFYMVAGSALYFAGYKTMMRRAQRVFFQPIFAPALFVVAGYFLGLPAPHMNQLTYVSAVALALVVLILATVSTSVYELMEA